MPDPLKSYDYYSSLVPSEYGVRKPLSMLHDQGMNTPPISLYSVPPSLRRAYIGQEPQMSVDTSQQFPKVNVNRDTNDFKQAQKNNPDALNSIAAQMAHENYHIAHGRAEGPAYDEQLRALKLFGAKPDQIANILRSKAHITEVESR